MPIYLGVREAIESDNLAGNNQADGRSILITGCSSGIGYHAAQALSDRGWRVFATCRKGADCERLHSHGLESMLLDYAHEDSIQNAVHDVLERTGGRLDAVFNNGAHALPALCEDVPRAALREIFEVNVFGYHDLIRRILPVMRRQGSGRIVNCSSILGFVGMEFRSAYVSTKYALEGLTDCLRLELSNSPVDVILIEPGPIKTRIRENARQKFEQWIDWERSGQRERYRDSLIPRLSSSEPDPFELPPSAVTAKLIQALDANRPQPRYYVTAPTYIAGLIKRVTSTRMMDRILSGR